MSQFIVDRAFLEKLHTRASAASRLVGYIDDSVDGASAAGPLAEEIDAIVHELSELLGNPHLIVAQVIAFPDDEPTKPHMRLRPDHGRSRERVQEERWGHFASAVLIALVLVGVIVLVTNGGVP